MKRFVMCRGLPGSGKSTWAEQQVLAAPAGQAVRINRDLLRVMLHVDRWKGNKTEVPTTEARDAIIVALMARGTPLIISDDTNLPVSVQEHLARLVAPEYDFEVKDFTDVPIKTCIERDLMRARSVGEQVIRRMYRDHLTPAPMGAPEYINGAAEVVLVDVDGTLAKMEGRSPYEWARVGEDSPIVQIVRMVEILRTSGLQIIFISGRDGSCVSETDKWLKRHAFKQSAEPLFMRPAGDQRKDAIVKREIYDEHIVDQYNVIYVLDDRDQVVEMWRGLGLTCLQVAPGDF